MLTERTVGPALFLFAHPDDEFGCFESIRIARDRGNRVVCVYLTDGAFGGQPAAPRMRESIAVLAQMGVAADDVHFVGVTHHIADGALVEHIALAYDALVAVMDGYGPPCEVYATAWEGGHPDHDATFLVARAYVKTCPPDTSYFQFSLYNGERLRGPFFRVMSPISSQGALTRLPMPFARRCFFLKLCLGYPSQWKTWAGLFPFVAARLIVGGAYVLQQARDEARSKPHEGLLLYERRSAMTWDAFAKACSAFMQA
jgi:hypothetical protein